MPKIGLLVGRENTFPPAFIAHVNERKSGVTAEYALLGGSTINDPSGYAVLIDRISHEIPYYASYLKNAALNGAVIINDPFWFPADDKFIGSAIAEKLGVAVPRTLALPHHTYIPDISRESLRNLVFPLPWQQFVEYTGLPAFLKPSVGGGWKYVFKVESVEELIRAFDQTGTLPMILQEGIEFEQYVRCICFGGTEIMPMRYNPKNPNMFERYEGEADAAYLGAALNKRVVEDARKLNLALGYTMNTVEFAIRDGIPYAIDFLNPACDLDSFSIGERAFEWALNTLGDMAIEFALHGAPPAHAYRWRTMIEGPSASAAKPEPKQRKERTFRGRNTQIGKLAFGLTEANTATHKAVIAYLKTVPGTIVVQREPQGVAGEEGYQRGFVSYVTSDGGWICVSSGPRQSDEEGLTMEKFIKQRYYAQQMHDDLTHP